MEFSILSFRFGLDFRVLVFLGLFLFAISFAECGDGVCDKTTYPYETCESCAEDCICPTGSVCDPAPDVDAYIWSVYFEDYDMKCVHIAECGDGFCDDTTPPEYHEDRITENCANCPADCGCSYDWYDWGNINEYGITDPDKYQFGPYDYCDDDSSSETYSACIRVSYCGDGVCDWEERGRVWTSDCEDCPETCTACPEDCDCEELTGIEGYVCDPTLENADTVGCGKPPICGDGYCDEKKDEEGNSIGEDCRNCEEDCGCDDGLSCEDTDVYNLGIYQYYCINTSSTGWAICDPKTDSYCRQHCGDGVCTPYEYEDCSSCALDCSCDSGQTCSPTSNSQDSRGCIYGTGECGDSSCDTGEDCINCPYDCFCEDNSHPDSELFCSDGVDEDQDGKTDCADDDCAFNSKCIGEENEKLAESLKDKYAEELKNRSMGDRGYLLDAIESTYSDRPGLMIQEMKKFMDQNVYGPERLDYYTGLFDGDEQRQRALEDIAASNDDPFARELALQLYTYQNCPNCMDAGTGLAFVGEKMLDPPKWFYGGEYGAGGVVDWSNVLARGVVDSMEATGEAPPKVIKYYATGTTIYIAVMDSKVLLEDAEVLSETNIEDNTKVGLIVLDGAMKISKLVDPTGYFSNLGDGTVGKVVQLAKKISDRSQGYFEWEGRILHQESDGNYVDIHTNEKFSRAGGGFFSSATFVPVTEGGSG